MRFCQTTTVFLIFLFLLLLFPIAVSAINYSATTSVEVLVVCGDGHKEIDEACDPPDYGSSTCQTFGYQTGELRCESDCSAILTLYCSTCNNGIKEGYEECDTDDFGGSTCGNFGYNTGLLDCTNQCLMNITNCASVGIPEPGDQGSQGGGSGGGGSKGGGLPVTGYLPGSDIVPSQTKVVIEGKGYPNSEVHILIDGAVVGIVKSDAKADFRFETTEVTPGVVSFGLWTEDKYGLKSTLLTMTFRVITGAITTISGAYIAPTIDLQQKTVKKGEKLGVYGQTLPETEVHVYFHSDEEIIEITDSDPSGEWQLEMDTSQLAEEEFHTTKALFAMDVSGNVVKSGFSRTLSFYVGDKTEDEAFLIGDLNFDAKVNLTDFSILLFYWGTNNKTADLNTDGKVDLVDFSIMLFNWTG